MQRLRCPPPSAIMVATAPGMLLTPCSPQDQLSADMYSFVAKEIDYANYFQTVSTASRPLPSSLCVLQQPRARPRGAGGTARTLCPLSPADRGAGRVPQEVAGASAERAASDKSPAG